MISNLLGITGALCVVAATAVLAGPMWALLLAGLLLFAMAWVLQSQETPEEETAEAIRSALEVARRRWEGEKQEAVAEAQVAAGRNLDETVATYKEQLLRAGLE